MNDAELIEKLTARAELAEGSHATLRAIVAVALGLPMFADDDTVLARVRIVSNELSALQVVREKKLRLEYNDAFDQPPWSIADGDCRGEGSSLVAAFENYQSARKAYEAL